MNIAKRSSFYNYSFLLVNYLVILITVAFGLDIASIEYLIPWVPIPEDLTPKNGKWSGPLSVLLLIWTVPTSNLSAT